MMGDSILVLIPKIQGNKLGNARVQLTLRKVQSTYYPGIIMSLGIFLRLCLLLALYLDC